LNKNVLELLDAEGPRLYTVLTRLALREEDAEDLMQDFSATQSI